MATKTVLVIEDNEKNMKLVRLLLQMDKYHVLEAETAEKGLEIVHRDRPDLILMDIQLPGMDGLEATALIKEDPRLASIPIVALTSYAMEGDEARCLDAGCDGYISKPIEPEEFVDNIKAYILPSDSLNKANSAEKGAHKERILIVDDDPKNLKLMCSMLAREEYELSTAPSGVEALEMVKEQPPDLILLDVMMPRMNGYEVTRRLKAGAETKSIPVILITALEDPADRAKGLEAGAEEFLTKPVNPIEIEARIKSMLILKRYRDQFVIRSDSENLICTESSDDGLPQVTGRPQRILIVEDDAKDVKLVQNHLVSSDYTLDVVRSGSEAVEIMRRCKYDLILLDILLPDFDGFEICRRIKQNESTAHTQVIIITCLRDMENKIKGVELGADDYLVKPIDPRELQARVKVLLKKKSYLDNLLSHYEKALSSALLDGLTGLYNHSYFKRFLELEIKRSQRQGHKTSLLMIDLDDFKQINDSLGHMAGDEILKKVGHLFKESIREIDVAARYGGEEFAVVLPYSDEKAIKTVGERLRTLIAATSFVVSVADEVLKVTISIGGAVYPDDANTPDELLGAADRMLYTAKSEGKNCLFTSRTEVRALKAL